MYYLKINSYHKCTRKPLGPLPRPLSRADPGSVNGLYGIEILSNPLFCKSGLLLYKFNKATHWVAFYPTVGCFLEKK